jgi:hypothetical protein
LYSSSLTRPSVLMQPVKTHSRRAIARGSPKYDHVHGVIRRVAAARA